MSDTDDDQTLPTLGDIAQLTLEAYGTLFKLRRAAYDCPALAYPLPADDPRVEDVRNLEGVLLGATRLLVPVRNLVTDTLNTSGYTDEELRELHAELDRHLDAHA